ncbi:MAG: class I SAM-dependent RNA methyltransferase [Cyclobacteriaceae bacterium]
MNIHIKTLFGLEEILAEEVRKIGGKNVIVHKRSVSCEGDLEFLYRANYLLRTALKVLVPIHKFTARTEQQLYDQVMKHDWSQYLTIYQTFAIDNTVFSEYFKHSQYAALKTKDAIVDQFRKKLGKRPSVDIKQPDIQFDLYAFKDQFTISIDSSGDTLNRRGYREPGHKAPMSEVLAAGLLKLAEWDPAQPLVDPMCGTGTILIEAALMGQNMPPQMHRDDFGFKNWKNFQPTLWQKVKSEGMSKIKKVKLNIRGGDIDGSTILNVNRSLRKLKLRDAITVRQGDMTDFKPDTSSGLLVCNPPYGERIGRDNTNEFYGLIGDTLKNNFAGFDAWILSSNMEAFKHMRLKTSKKIVLFNGPLECKFQKYEMYKGTKPE